METRTHCSVVTALTIVVVDGGAPTSTTPEVPVCSLLVVQLWFLPAAVKLTAQRALWLTHAV